MYRPIRQASALRMFTSTVNNKNKTVESQESQMSETLGTKRSSSVALETKLTSSEFRKS